MQSRKLCIFLLSLNTPSCCECVITECIYFLATFLSIVSAFIRVDFRTVSRKNRTISSRFIFRFIHCWLCGYDFCSIIRVRKINFGRKVHFSYHHTKTWTLKFWWNSESSLPPSLSYANGWMKRSGERKSNKGTGTEEKESERSAVYNVHWMCWVCAWDHPFCAS